MEGLIDVFKQKAQLVANVAGLKSHSVKLRADIAFLERDIKNRQYAFGVQLYDHVSVWSAKPDFFAANDDNILIATIRPPLIRAQREIAALHLKRTSIKERLNVVTSSRTASYNQKSDHWTETIQNAGKTTIFAGNEAKLMTELTLVEREIKNYKHIFGVAIFQQFSLLEDTQQWLPTDREIRSYYDSCRKDIDGYKQKIQQKEQEVINLDTKGKGIWNGTESIDNDNNNTNTSYNRNSPHSGGSSPNKPTLGFKAKSTSPTHSQQQQQQQGWYGGQPVGFLQNEQQQPQQPQFQQPAYISPATQSSVSDYSAALTPQLQQQQYASDNGLFRYSNDTNTNTNTNTNTSNSNTANGGGFDGLF